jgi:hypothetical protein
MKNKEVLAWGHPRKLPSQILGNKKPFPMIREAMDKETPLKWTENSNKNEPIFPQNPISLCKDPTMM